MKLIEIEKEIRNYPNSLRVVINTKERDSQLRGVCGMFDLDLDTTFYNENEKSNSGFESYEEAVSELEADIKEEITDKLEEVKELFKKDYEVTFMIDEELVNSIANTYMIFAKVIWE